MFKRKNPPVLEPSLEDEPTEQSRLKAEMSVSFPKREKVEFQSNLSADGLLIGFSIDFNVDRVFMQRDDIGETENFGLTDSEMECKRRFEAYVNAPYEDEHRDNYGEQRSFPMLFNLSKFSTGFTEYQNKVVDFKGRSIAAQFCCGALFFGYRIELVIDNALIIPAFFDAEHAFRYSEAKLVFQEVRMSEENSKKNHDGTPAELTTLRGDIETVNWS